MSTSPRYVIDQKSATKVCVWLEVTDEYEEIDISDATKLNAEFTGESCLDDAREAFPGAVESHSWTPDDEADDFDYAYEHDLYDYDDEGSGWSEDARAERRQMMCD